MSKCVNPVVAKRKRWCLSVFHILSLRVKFSSATHSFLTTAKMFNDKQICVDVHDFGTSMANSKYRIWFNTATFRQSLLKSECKRHFCSSSEMKSKNIRLKTLNSMFKRVECGYCVHVYLHLAKSIIKFQINEKSSTIAWFRLIIWIILKSSYLRAFMFIYTSYFLCF